MTGFRIFTTRRVPNPIFTTAERVTVLQHNLYERLEAWFGSRGTKVKTQGAVTSVNGNKRGDLELESYISQKAQDLVLDLYDLSLVRCSAELAPERRTAPSKQPRQGP